MWAKVLSLLLASAIASPWSVLAWSPSTTSSVIIGGSRRSTSSRSTPLNAATSTEVAVNNNVVLRPSDDPEAFDSFKIGSAKVHRYVRDGDGLDQPSEWMMWYHGRPKKGLDDENDDKDGSSSKLPPLSTGRIGRATSRNGLIWTKERVGSESEDAKDVTLGLNKESWWGFDTAHVGLGQVLLPMSTPAIMTEGGVYLMYFFGGNHEETKVADYLDNLPSEAATATMKGMNMKIGIALSQDGKSFGRVEGDDPTGACVAPYDESDPDQKAIADAMRDEDGSKVKLEEELYCAWPEVTLKIAANDGEEKGGTSFMGNNKQKQQKPSFFMYYSTMRKADKAKCLACAVSLDGFRWMKRGNVITPGEPGEMDDAGCARCNVFQEASYDSATNVWKEQQDGWHMLYEGVSSKDKKHRIMLAESEDGRRWTKKGVVFDVGPTEDSWDCGGVGAPHVIRLDDGSMRMYYTGQGADGSTAIGVAMVPPGGSIYDWKREQAQISVL